MNWKFDFSPETSAVLNVSDLLQYARILKDPLRQDQAFSRKTYT